MFVGFVKKSILSSANNNRNICNSSRFTIPSKLQLILLKISFKKNKHKTLLNGSPCFTPIYVLIKSEVVCLYRMNDLTDEYIALIAWINFVLTLSDESFCHKNALSILSNIFPSIVKQHKVFSWMLKFSILEHEL